MNGKIVKGIAGFYYVNTHEGIYECKAKGVFRKKKIKPLVGDNVDIEILDDEKKLGNIIDICERKNSLIRPAVANIDQAVVIFAAAKPTPNLNLLDRFLISMSRQNVECIVCFNKQDVASEKELELLKNTYEKSGYKVVTTSALNNEGIDVIKDIIANKTTVLAGPSGVGKSSLINIIYPKANMETGSISEKIERGRHTTRHSELFLLDDETYIMDTPGFSSLYVDDMQKEELKEHFIEFNQYIDECKFQGCNHINEPGCVVKEAVNNKDISQTRYDNYVQLYNEIKDKKKY